MTALLFLFRHLDHFKTRFVLVFLVSFLDGAASFFIPILLADFTRAAMSWPAFGRLMAWLVACQLASNLFQWILRRYGESLGQQYGNHLRRRYFAELRHVPFAVLHRHHSGYVLGLANKVADGMAPIVFEMFWTIGKGAAILLLFLLYTARESLAVAGANLALMLLFIVVSIVLSRQIVPLVQKLNEKRAALLASYTDLMANILTIKKLGLFSFADQELVGRTHDVDRQIETLQRFHALRWFVLHTLYAIASYGTIAYLLYQIVSGWQTPSVLILFLAGFLMVKGIVERLSETFKNLMDMRAYIGGMNEVTRHRTPEGTQTPPSWHTITFSGVHFRHDTASTTLRVPEFTLRKGGIVLVTGPSGQGKSSFLNLLANFLHPQQGQRWVDQTAYDDLQHSFFEQHMAFIAQEIELLNTSLRKNLTLDRPHDEARLMAWLDRLQLTPWIRSLENGLDTRVGEKGILLSAGQKQRINLLRGLMLQRDIVLLDEPTSHLDGTTEAAVITLLGEALQGRTAVIVSHREGLRRLCTAEYAVQDHTLIRV